MTLSLLSKEPVEKLIFFDSNDNLKEQSDVWYELADVNDRVIARNDLSSFIKSDMEIFSDQPEQSISRRKIDKISGTFSLLVPEVEDAGKFDILARPAAKQAEGVKAAGPRNVFHLDLKNGGTN